MQLYIFLRNKKKKSHAFATAKQIPTEKCHTDTTQMPYLNDQILGKDKSDICHLDFFLLFFFIFFLRVSNKSIQTNTN